MNFLLTERIDNYERFCAWFNTSAIPKIEAAGGKVILQGVQQDDEQQLHLVMSVEDPQTLEAFMSDPGFTAERIAAGVDVESTQLTFLK